MDQHNSGATDWVALLGDFARTGGLGLQPAPEPKGIQWRLRLAKSLRSAPVLGGDILYVSCLDGFLHAIDTRTGRLAWKFDAGAPIHATPSLSGDKVLFGCDGGQV